MVAKGIVWDGASVSVSQSQADFSEQKCRLRPLEAGELPEGPTGKGKNPYG